MYEEEFGLFQRKEIEDDDYKQGVMTPEMKEFSGIFIVFVTLVCLISMLIVVFSFFPRRIKNRKIQLYFGMAQFILMVILIPFRYLSYRILLHDHANKVVDNNIFLVTKNIIEGYSFKIFIFCFIPIILSTFMLSFYSHLEKIHRKNNMRIISIEDNKQLQTLPSIQQKQRLSTPENEKTKLSTFQYLGNKTQQSSRDLDQCPYCGNFLKFSTTPRFCPNCNGQLLK